MAVFQLLLWVEVMTKTKFYTLSLVGLLGFILLFLWVVRWPMYTEAKQVDMLPTAQNSPSISGYGMVAQEDYLKADRYVRRFPKINHPMAQMQSPNGQLLMHFDERLFFRVGPIDPLLSIPFKHPIVYVENRYDSGGGSFLVISDLYDTTERLYWFQTEGQISNPLWSPNGKHIAFSLSFDSGPRNLYVAELQTGKFSRITNDVYTARASAWSPDSEKLLFLQRESYPSQNQTFMLDIASNEVEELKFDGEVFHAEWSPAGDEIVISLADSAYESAQTRISSLYLVQVDDLEQVELMFEGEWGLITDIKWSPDGEKIAFIQTSISAGVRAYLHVIWVNAQKPAFNLGANIYNPIWDSDSENILMIQEPPMTGKCSLMSVDLNQTVTDYGSFGNDSCPMRFDWYQRH